ncbi:MAG TPA: L-ribulose-5-phosphate 4-epimerase AraD [Candidatus Aminicenantes bacterium]|nr:MAG: L-ribulose-5-phosphate 4-epimerase [Candidatus Aminicenantes bacterium]HEK85443.1 L-ribulose-5-phosphate 4-epimerase AraD [Candidatus Aminicenantes bacterium]
MYEDLKKRVYEANLRLVKYGLVILTFGNVSEIDREKGVLAIKPSGVDYERMTPADMVVLNLEGRVVDGHLRPSSDTPTHIYLYKSFPGIRGIAHAHSDYATAFAQARTEIPCLGTTQPDFAPGPIPVTRELSEEEVSSDYELNTGKVIAERFALLDPIQYPACLVAGHGPFAWGKSGSEAADNLLDLEKIAKMAFITRLINPEARPLKDYLLKKHFERKHGPKAYYGQGKEK